MAELDAKIIRSNGDVKRQLLMKEVIFVISSARLSEVQREGMASGLLAIQRPSNLFLSLKTIRRYSHFSYSQSQRCIVKPMTTSCASESTALFDPAESHRTAS